MRELLKAEHKRPFINLLMKPSNRWDTTVREHPWEMPGNSGAPILILNWIILFKCPAAKSGGLWECIDIEILGKGGIFYSILVVITSSILVAP